MAVFVTRRDFDLCFEYCMLISECLDYNKNCYGWNSGNYSDEECIWKCLVANRYHVLQDIEALCNSDLVARSSIAREVCRELGELQVFKAVVKS